jgi:hypothetical protein
MKKQPQISENIKIKIDSCVHNKMGGWVDVKEG